MKTKFTIARNLHYTKYGLIEKSINEVIDIIRAGDLQLYDPDCGTYSLKKITNAIRIEPSAQRQNDWKARFLPVVFFNGIWDGARISEYSNITALDFDFIDTDEQLAQTLSDLKRSPYVLAIFRTFKPKRIKALIIHDNTDPAKHKEMYEQLISLFGITLIDASCKDLSRKTYLPWDEDIWVNVNCTPYHFIPTATMPIKPFSVKGNGKTKSPQSIINIMNSSWRKNHSEYWREGYRANSIFKCACLFCEYGVPQDMAEDYFLNGGWIADEFTADEVIKHVRGAYGCNKNNFGCKDFI